MTIQKAREIWGAALSQFDPFAVVAMVSGGDDSLAALLAAIEIGVPLDYIVHGNTRTGTQKTTQYVIELAAAMKIPLLMADAGDAFEKYVERKGFFGRGRKAHTFAYHVLKAQPLRKAISRGIRQGKRNRTILMISGARVEESENRKNNLTDIFNADPAQKGNVWVNLIHDWTKDECMDLIESSPVRRNPVAEFCGRSGECMCGTMQCETAYAGIKYVDPEWGARMDALRSRITERHGWDWGDDVPAWVTQRKQGQLALPLNEFRPMCHSCIAFEEATA